MIKAIKPSGINTHKVSEEKNFGFYEHLQKSFPDIKLIHRLDQGTSGAMVFGQTKEECQGLSQAFEQHLVKKTYLFLSEKDLDIPKDLKIESKIKKEGNKWVSEDKADFNNACTVISKIRTTKKYTLYKAEPITGKTHQIRLHAKKIGAPILGDDLYGGGAFHRLALHCLNIELKEHEPNFSHFAEPPLYFKRLELLNSTITCQFLDEYYWRYSLYNPLMINPNQCLRVAHNHASELRADKLGPVMWMGWWGDQALPTADRECLKAALEHLEINNYILQHRKNREAEESNPILMQYDCPETWQAQEGKVTFELRKNQGMSPGVFLDQRSNRSWVIENSDKKRVLNLFSYTGVFSACAALGGALRVDTVDVSQKYIDWSKKNFELNQIENPKAEFNFYAMGFDDYIKFAHKKGVRFDLIICDPPSFGRDGKKVFKLEKDWKDLASSIKELLAPKGRILFSCNLEKWNQHKFETIWSIWARRNDFKTIACPEPELDFERPFEERILKTILLELKEV